MYHSRKWRPKPNINYHTKYKILWIQKEAKHRTIKKRRSETANNNISLYDEELVWKLLLSCWLVFLAFYFLQKVHTYHNDSCGICCFQTENVCYVCMKFIGEKTTNLLQCRCTWQYSVVYSRVISFCNWLRC